MYKYFAKWGYNILKPFIYLQHETADYNIWQIFGEFMDGLTIKEREKVDYGLVLLKTQDRLPTKFVKHIREGLQANSVRI